MNDPRDTQFTGFAQLLWQDLLDANGMGYINTKEGDDPSVGWGPAYPAYPGYLTIIARRAYDLVLHTIDSMNPIAPQCLDNDEIVHATPDLTEWPKQEQGEGAS